MLARSSWRWSLPPAALSLLLAAAPATLQDGRVEAAESPRASARVRPGLLACYSSVADPPQSFCRIDGKISSDWRDGVPDERLQPDGFRARWTGRLLVPEDATYRFSLDGLGSGTVSIDGRTVASFRQPATRPIPLDYGFHDLRVSYESPAGGGAVCLRWGRDASPLDVVPARSLFRGTRDVLPQTDDLYERGRLLADHLGCERCHEAPRTGAAERAQETRAPMTSLRRAGWTRPGYLVNLLLRPREMRLATPMMELRGSPQERERDARALAAFLRSASEPLPPAMNHPPGTAKQGRERFRALGCVACHRPESPPAEAREDDPTAPPSLVDAGVKWPPHILVQLLRRHWEFRPWGVMPSFDLDELPAVDIAAYLASLPAPALRVEPTPDEADLVARGRQLFRERRCSPCHEVAGLPDEEASTSPVTDLAGMPLEEIPRGCLSRKDGRLPVPWFDLGERDRRALSVYYRHRPRTCAPVALQEQAQRETEEQLGCLRCHERDGTGGEALRAAVLEGGAATHGGVTNLPPDLSDVGTRLRRDWIRSILEGPMPAARPWLTVPMPQFALREEQITGIVSFLITADRGPPEERTEEKTGLPPPDARPHGTVESTEELRKEGSVLLGPQGFNCQYCHVLGKHEPAADTRGPDLTLTRDRIERDWFFRWLEDPQRWRPQTAMPTFLAPMPGILGESLEAQREALWIYLTETPPAEIAAQETAPRGLEPNGRPLIVQARVRGPGRLRADRGVALALPPGPSLLFDAGRLSWLGSWRGGFLERVGHHGAHAWWRPRGDILAEGDLGDGESRSAPVLLRDGGGETSDAWRGPALHRGRFGWFEHASYEDNGVRLEYSLRLGKGRWLRVAESVEARRASGGALQLERSVELLQLQEQSTQKKGSGQFVIPVIPELIGLSGLPREIDQAAAGVAVDALPALSWPGGRVEVAGDASLSWAVAPSRILYPVLEPLEDGLPPGASFPPESEDGRQRIAVAVGQSSVGRGKALRIVLARDEKDESDNESRVSRQSPAGKRKPMAVSSLPNLDVSSVAVPSGYAVERLPLSEDFLPCALAFYRDRLLVAGYDGEVRWALDTGGDGIPDRYELFGGPLDQVNSLVVRGDAVIVASPGGVYSLTDRDQDGVADDYRTLSSQWDYSGHPFDWFFGFAVDREGNLYGANTTPHERGDVPGHWRRGNVLKITPKGTTSVHATGNRYEFGWTVDRAGRSFFTVNQGPWNITCSIRELTEGAFYGYGEQDASRVTPPVVLVPYPWCRSLSGIAVAETGGRFGIFEGQGFAGDYNTRRIIRWTHHAAGKVRQGSCYDFALGLDCGVTGLCFGPDGALYVAVMADGAWYPDRPRGGIYRIVAVDDADGPLEILEARATATGFEIRFTSPVDPSTLEGACRKVHRYYHEYRGGYNSVETVHEDVAVSEVTLLEDRRTVRLRLASPHLTPRIYRVRFRGLRSHQGRPVGEAPFFLTLHTIPPE